MTRARALMAGWVIVGAIVWLGVFDYVNTRGHKEYLYRNAELRLGIQLPDAVLMSRLSKDAAVRRLGDRLGFGLSGNALIEAQQRGLSAT